MRRKKSFAKKRSSSHAIFMIKVIFLFQWVITKYCPVHKTSKEAYEEFSFFGRSLVTDIVLSPKSFLAPLRPGVEIATYSSRAAEFYLCLHMSPPSFLFLQSVLLGSNLTVISLDTSFPRAMTISVLFTMKFSAPKSVWNRICIQWKIGGKEGRKAEGGRREEGEEGGRKEGDSSDDCPLLVPYLSGLYILALLAIIAW